MKNILHIIPSRGWGGGERYVFDLSETLLGRGYKVVFAGRKSAPVEPIFAKLARYYPLKLASMFDFGSAYGLARIIKSDAIDVIHVHIFKDAFMAALAVKFSGRSVKIVMTRHLVKRGKSGFMYGWLYRRLDKIIFVSYLARNEFLSGKPEITLDKTCVIHNSVIVPATIEKCGDLRAKYGLVSTTELLGFSGRLSTEKGVETAIEAMSILHNRDTALVIAGSGDDKYTNDLKSLVSKLGLGDRVFFEGFVTNNFAFVNQIDIAVLPSRWREPFGLVILEYLSQGVVVITTNNGAQKEIIDDRVHGILIAPDDPSSLAAAVCEVMDDQGLRKSLSENGIAKVSEFSIEKYVDKIEMIYNQ